MTLRIEGIAGSRFKFGCTIVAFVLEVINIPAGQDIVGKLAIQAMYQPNSHHWRQYGSTIHRIDGLVELYPNCNLGKQ